MPREVPRVMVKAISETVWVVSKVAVIKVARAAKAAKAVKAAREASVEVAAKAASVAKAKVVVLKVAKEGPKVIMVSMAAAEDSQEVTLQGTAVLALVVACLLVEVVASLVVVSPATTSVVAEEVVTLVVGALRLHTLQVALVVAFLDTMVAVATTEEAGSLPVWRSRRLPELGEASEMAIGSALTDKPWKHPPCVPKRCSDGS